MKEPTWKKSTLFVIHLNAHKKVLFTSNWICGNFCVMSTWAIVSTKYMCFYEINEICNKNQRFKSNCSSFSRQKERIGFVVVFAGKKQNIVVHLSSFHAFVLSLWRNYAKFDSNLFDVGGNVSKFSAISIKVKTFWWIAIKFNAEFSAFSSMKETVLGLFVARNVSESVLIIIICVLWDISTTKIVDKNEIKQWARD